MSCLCSGGSSVAQYQIIQQPTWRCMRGFSPLLRSQIRLRVSCVISFSFSSSPYLLVMFSNIKIANIPFPPGFLAPSTTKAVARVVQSEGIQCILSYHVKHNMWWCSTTNRTNYSSFQHTATQLDFRADWMVALHPNNWKGKRWIIITFLSAFIYVCQWTLQDCGWRSCFISGGCCANTTYAEVFHCVSFHDWEGTLL